MLCSQSEFTLSNEVASTRHVDKTIITYQMCVVNLLLHCDKMLPGIKLEIAVVLRGF